LIGLGRWKKKKTITNEENKDEKLFMKMTLWNGKREYAYF
jgi:hypothetical protein